MIPEFITGVLTRDLRALRRQIEAYENEADLWKVPPGIRNSAGTLALHCAGNLQHFVGAELGSTGFVRDRPAEFASRDVPREELLAGIDEALAAVEAGLTAVEDEDLGSPYRQELGATRVRMGDFLIHLATHLAFHLGQVDYHRRLVTGDARSVDPVAIPELASAVAGADTPQ